jgi:hypothetical protein
MDEAVHAPCRFIVRITQGDHMGEYVGTISGFPLVGASQNYFLHPDEGMAYQFL